MAGLKWWEELLLWKNKFGKGIDIYYSGWYIIINKEERKYNYKIIII